METTVTTFATVERAGMYKCGSCGDNQIPMDAGEVAQGCPNCQHRPVTWHFVRPLGQRPIGFALTS